MITTVPNFLRNSTEIIYALHEYQHLFKPREGDDVHTSIVPKMRSRFKTLKHVDMKQSLINLIFKDNDFDSFLKDSYEFIQIQKYDVGDSITVHKDIYSITKLHLVILTSSDSDGFCYEGEDFHWQKIYDVAGTYIDNINDKWHFVAPVKDVRYSLVIAE